MKSYLIGLFIACLVVGLASCQSSGSSSVPSAPVNPSYQAFAELVSGKWQATPLTTPPSRDKPIAVEITVSPPLALTGATTAEPYALGVVTITTPAWSAHAQVYRLDRTEGDQFFDRGYLVDASESEAVPLAGHRRARHKAPCQDAGNRPDQLIGACICV